MAKLVIKGSNSKSRLWLARRMAERLAGALPGRQVRVMADSAYADGELKGLPARISWTTRLRKDAALQFLSPHAIQHIVRALTAHELSEDPHDLVARYLLHSTSHLNSGITLFGAIYLLSYGIAKIVLVALVLRDKLWAYPWLIALLLAFIAYQIYRLGWVHFSIGLTALTVFDAALVWLTWREYRSKRAHKDGATRAEPRRPAARHRPATSRTTTRP